MLTIYKYTIQNSGVIELPLNAVILSTGFQRDTGIVLWVKVDTSERKFKQRKFNTYGTGWAIEDQCCGNEEVFIGTVTDVGGYVWHVFEELR